MLKISIVNIFLKLLKYNWTLWLVVWVAFVMLFPSKIVYAQDFQLWMEAGMHKDFGEYWKYNAVPIFRKYIEQDGWYKIGLKNTFSRKIVAWLTADCGIDFFYTVDNVNTDIGEIRPWLDAKLIYPHFIKTIHLDKLYFSSKIEERFLWYPEEDKDDQKTRLRLKVGGTFILNNEKMVDKTFYMPWYLEGFYNFNGSAFEQNASIGRAMLGLGYVFSPEWRGEFDYIVQDSRNTLEEGFYRTDDIFQFKVDYYFDK